MLIASVRTCCSEMRQPSASTVCTISASRSCGPSEPAARAARRCCSSMTAANSGNAPAMPSPRSVLPSVGHVLCSSSLHQSITWSCSVVGHAELVRGDRTRQRDRQLAPSGRRRRRPRPPPAAGARWRASSPRRGSAAAGVNPRSSRRRMRGCSGASSSPRKLSSSGTVTPGARMSPTDDKRLGVAEALHRVVEASP